MNFKGKSHSGKATCLQAYAIPRPSDPCNRDTNARRWPFQICAENSNQLRTLRFDCLFVGFTGRLNVCCRSKIHTGVSVIFKIKMVLCECRANICRSGLPKYGEVLVDGKQFFNRLSLGLFRGGLVHNCGNSQEVLESK